MEVANEQTRRSGLFRDWWMWLLLIPVLSLLLAGTAAARLADNVYTVDLTLHGEQEMVLEYGASFLDPGASAEVSGTVLLQTPQKMDVSVSGMVDAGRVGVYTLTYQADFEGISQTKTRTVRITDTKAPAITLKTVEGWYTKPGQAYEEEGFTAFDEYDGDISDRVIREESDGKVCYTVSDSSGNMAQVTREILYDDRTPPVITLNGAQTVTVYKGAGYGDAGCSAIDDCAGDISDRVTVSGSVDYNRAGSYVLTYCAEDDYGNAASVQRVVHVVAPRGSGKTIYLTFDDGPGPYTNQLLNVLKKYNVKATFFLVNTGSISVAKRIVAEGHAVGIHSINHKYSDIYASREAYMKDLYGMQEIIRKHTGVTTYLMRFPGGSSNTVSRITPGLMTQLTKHVEQAGFRYFDWNVSSSDTSKGISSDKIYQNVIKGISKTTNSVVLQHDIYKSSVDAVERIILWGLENGYTFAALDHSSPTAHHRVNN